MVKIKRHSHPKQVENKLDGERDEESYIEYTNITNNNGKLNDTYFLNK